MKIRVAKRAGIRREFVPLKLTIRHIDEGKMHYLLYYKLSHFEDADAMERVSKHVSQALLLDLCIRSFPQQRRTSSIDLLGLYSKTFCFIQTCNSLSSLYKITPSHHNANMADDNPSGNDAETPSRPRKRSHSSIVMPPPDEIKRTDTPPVIADSEDKTGPVLTQTKEELYEQAKTRKIVSCKRAGKREVC